MKCPLHGDRFKRPQFFIYIASWRRAQGPARRQTLSAPYHKAWDASFPSELWPAEEEQGEDGVYPAPEGWHSVAGGKTCPDTLTLNLELMGFSVRPGEPGVSYYLGWRGTEMARVTNRTR